MIARARLLVLLLATLIVSSSLAPSAGAHVQVKPAEAAPADSVEFTVLVPGETDARTTEVALAIPPDVIPFSFGETPGWKLTKKEAADGSIAELVWSGSLATDGFVRLSFLASTPEQPTTIVWKAIQRYSDGETARWIGSPESEYPAARTVITKSADVQGAGGSHSGASGTDHNHGATESEPASGHGAMGAAALVAALLALVLSSLALLRTRRAR